MYSITINGTDRTADVLAQTITVDDVLNDQANTCQLNLMDVSGNGIPEPDQEIIITLADGTKLFAGYILKVKLQTYKSGNVVAQIKCVDYTRLLDQALVHDSYEDMTDKEVIEEIIETYCPDLGITTNNVLENATIDQITFNYVQVSQALRQICELTGYFWYIDYDKDIHFFPLTQNPAPLSLTDDLKSYRFIENTDNDTLIGSVGGDATHDTDNGYIQLINTDTYQSGYWRYNYTLPSTFIIQADIWIGGGTGADAMWFMFGANADPTNENDGQGGYSIAFDDLSDEIQLYFDTSLLASESIANLDNSTWKTIKIVIDGIDISVIVDDETILEYTDTERSLAGNRIYAAARSGAATNEHRVRDISVYREDTGSQDYRNLELIKDASKLKNRVYVRGGTKLSDYVDYNELGDGEKTKFVLPDKPHDVTVEVNGSPETVGVKHVDTEGYDWYLNYQEKYIEQDEGGSVLTDSDVLTVTYKYDVPILIAQEDGDSIATHGVKEFAIFDKTITTTQAARDRAAAELTDYAENTIEGKFITMTDGFVSGQFVYIDLADYGVDGSYIVQRVISRSLGSGKFEYEVSLISVKTIGIIKFLIQLLEANKNLIELDPNEVVDELFSVTDSLGDSLEDSLTIDSAPAASTWCVNDSDEAPDTRARWDLFQWA